MNLLCGSVSRSSVETALGRSEFTVTGGLIPAESPNADGTTFSRATCSAALPGEAAGQAKAFTVTVDPVAVTDLNVVQTSRPEVGADYVYPAGTGVGFASRDSFTDDKGILHKTADSGLIRGDWTITVGIATPAAGRDPLADVIAVVQEVIEVLKVPLKPSQAYPASFYAVDSSPSKP